MAYLTLFGWSFLAATFVPVGSEPMVIALIHQRHSVFAVVAVATAGNFAGACTTYGIARRVARALSDTPANRTTRRATALIASYGAPALLLSWLPLLGDAIVAAAGAARMPFMRFSAWTAVGKLVRYVAVAWGAAAWA